MVAVKRIGMFGAVLAGAAALAGCRTAQATGSVAGTVGGAAIGGVTAGARAATTVGRAAGSAIIGAASDRSGNGNTCFERGVEITCPPQ